MIILLLEEVCSNSGTIDITGFSERLGVPAVPISAAKNEGIYELIKVVYKTGRNKVLPKVKDFCDAGPIHRCIHAVSHLIEDHAENTGIAPRFAAIKLIEGDGDIIARLELNRNELDMTEHSITEMEAERRLDRNAAIADIRYTFIEKACAETVVKCHESREHKRSKKIDNILTNKYLAIPLFLCIMMLVFWLSFGVIESALSGLFELCISKLTDITEKALTAYGINPVVRSLVIDGIFAGVGSVLSFLPIIVTLFFSCPCSRTAVIWQELLL